MNNPQERRTQLTLDCKKFRLRLRKDMLPLLGDPKYVQLLVNPDKSLIAIHGVDQELIYCEVVKVARKEPQPDNCHEIYSKRFVEKLCNLADGLDHGASYRLTGHILPEDRVAVFSLLSAEKLES